MFVLRYVSTENKIQGSIAKAKISGFRLILNSISMGKKFRTENVIKICEIENLYSFNNL